MLTPSNLSWLSGWRETPSHPSHTIESLILNLYMGKDTTDNIWRDIQLAMVDFWPFALAPHGVSESWEDTRNTDSMASLVGNWKAIATASKDLIESVQCLRTGPSLSWVGIVYSWEQETLTQTSLSPEFSFFLYKEVKYLVKHKAKVPVGSSPFRVFLGIFCCLYKALMFPLIKMRI